MKVYRTNYQLSSLCWDSACIQILSTWHIYSFVEPVFPDILNHKNTKHLESVLMCISFLMAHVSCSIRHCGIRMKFFVVSRYGIVNALLRLISQNWFFCFYWDIKPINLHIVNDYVNKPWHFLLPPWSFTYL